MKTGRARDNYKPNDDYYTPKWIFDKLNIIFDLDVCGPSSGSNVPALKTFTINQDGLVQNWCGSVWMNPPFSKQKPWVDKFIEHKNGIALLPWYRSQHLLKMWNIVDAICMLPSNLKFDHPVNGSKSIFSSCGLFAFGESNVEALQKMEVRTRK
jgi:hypothetical protein